MNKIYLIVFYLLFPIFSFGQHTDLLKEKGLEKMNAGNYAEAIPYFKEAISIDSSLLNLHYNYAYSLLMVHKYEKSITEFKKVTLLDPSGLKQPKAGKRRVRGNSGGNAKDIDIFADLNDLALNPED